MINRKILMSGFSIVSALALMGGSAFAYFTSQASANNNVFTAGTLTVDITDQNADTAFVNENLASNWKPGDETLVNFDVKNNGTLPVNFSGIALGTWNNSALDSQNAVKVIKVERWNGASWETLTENTSGITGTFYYTNDGTAGGTAINVPAGGRAQLQLTVKFDNNAGNDFAGQVFQTQIQVNAKQVNAPW